MKALQTIELSDQERIVVQQFLKFIDDISRITGRSMDNVFEYFAEEAKSKKRKEKDEIRQRQT